MAYGDAADHVRAEFAPLVLALAHDLPRALMPDFDPT
jgi:hypothetical protein